MTEYLPKTATFQVRHSVEFARKAKTRRELLRRIEIDFGGNRTIDLRGESLSVLLDRALDAARDRGLLQVQEKPS